MNTGIIDRLIDRLDKLEPEEVERLVLRTVQEKGFLEKVFEVVRDGIIVCSEEGSVHYINHAACDFFGIESKVAIRGTVSELFPGFDWEEVARSGGVINRDLVVRYPELRYINFYIAPLTGEGETTTELDPDSSLENLGGFVIILRDNTLSRERRLKEIESEKIQAVQSLAAGVAHEIGNPLNSLNIHLQVIERKIKKHAEPEIASELLESLEISRDEIKRLDFIVDQFLNAVRPSKPNLETTDLNDLIKEAITFIGAETADRRITITLELKEDLPLVSIDRDQLKQVFYNLIRNSSQAIGSDGHLTITTDYNDENTFITFADDGPGIPPDQVSRVFEPYYTTKKTGSGLGLMIVHRIVHDHGGEIEFKSREGIGTEVSVFLPRVEKLMRFLPEKSETPVIDIDVVT